MLYCDSCSITFSGVNPLLPLCIISDTLPDNLTAMLPCLYCLCLLLESSIPCFSSSLFGFLRAFLISFRSHSFTVLSHFSFQGPVRILSTYSEDTYNADFTDSHFFSTVSSSFHTPTHTHSTMTYTHCNTTP